MSQIRRNLLPVLKGLRNGLQYGSRVRFVHGLVMTFLFKTFNSQTVKQIFKNALQHGKKLGLFVFVYKLCCLGLAKMFGERPSNSFIAGFIVGGFVFGKKTPINYQINLYLLSRILVGLIEYVFNKYLKQKKEDKQSFDKQEEKFSIQQFFKNNSFKILAGLVWGCIMWLYFIDPSVLQQSLTSSMKFLYKDSEVPIKTWKEFIPFSKYK